MRFHSEEAPRGVRSIETERKTMEVAPATLQVFSGYTWPVVSVSNSTGREHLITAPQNVLLHCTLNTAQPPATSWRRLHT